MSFLKKQHSRKNTWKKRTTAVSDKVDVLWVKEIIFDNKEHETFSMLNAGKKTISTMLTENNLISTRTILIIQTVTK